MDFSTGLNYFNLFQNSLQNLMLQSVVHFIEFSLSFLVLQYFIFHGIKWAVYNWCCYRNLWQITRRLLMQLFINNIKRLFDVVGILTKYIRLTYFWINSVSSRCVWNILYVFLFSLILKNSSVGGGGSRVRTPWTAVRYKPLDIIDYHQNYISCETYKVDSLILSEE